jgi:hypothetical protein
MPGQKYQDPKIETRTDAKKPYYSIRPFVPVVTREGIVRKQKRMHLGFCDEISMREAKARKEQIMATVNAGKYLVQSQLPFSAILKRFREVRLPQIGSQAVCVDMWPAFTNSIQHWLPHARIVYDKFHIMQHANHAVDEVRRAEFFRKGGRMRGIVKGKRWLLLTRWVNLESRKRQELNGLFALNRRVMKAYLLKESLDRLWTYRYEGAMVRYLQRWMDQLRWQRLRPFQKLAEMLLDHLVGILNYCRVPVRFGVVEAINGNIKALLRRGRGYTNLRYLLLKAQRMAALKTEFLVLRKAA